MKKMMIFQGVSQGAKHTNEITKAFTVELTTSKPTGKTSQNQKNHHSLTSTALNDTKNYFHYEYLNISMHTQRLYILAIYLDNKMRWRRV